MKNVKIVETVTHTHTHTNRKERGITLIALIITVILLLILAGVAINFALGDNGILRGAEYATDKYQNKAEQEQNELAKIDDYIQNGRATVTISKEEYEKLKKANTYTTDEVEIGTWIDGKIIYRRIISLPSGISSTGTVHMVGDYSWVEHFLRADAIGDDTNNEMSAVFCKSEGTSGLKLWCAEGFSTARYIILEYTKKDIN